MNYTMDGKQFPVYSRAMSLQDVANELLEGALDDGHRIGDVRLTFGTNLEVEFIGEDTREVFTFTLHDIYSDRDFYHADFYVWAKSEKGENVLLCLCGPKP